MIALIASFAGISSSYWLYGRGLDSQAALGRAVITVWDRLDDKARAQIEQAF